MFSEVSIVFRIDLGTDSMANGIILVHIDVTYIPPTPLNTSVNVTAPSLSNLRARLHMQANIVAWSSQTACFNG
jgi:hypothetical protein